MYGLIVELADGGQGLAEVGEALAAVGYERIVDGVYLCSKPRRTELLAVHDAIEAMHNLPWLADAVAKVVAIRVDELGDITDALVEDSIDEYNELCIEHTR